LRWPLVPLSDVAEVSGGSTPRSSEDRYWDGSIPWVTPTDLPMPGTEIADVYDTKDNITEQGLSSISAPLLRPGAVLFSSRASIGKVGIARVPLATNQGFVNFSPRQLVDSKFLANCLQHFTPQIASLASSTTFREVSRGSIRKFKIPLPPLSEQRRIVEILDQADALRRLRAEADAKAQRILPALFLKMFGEGAANSSRWPSQKISQLAEQRRGSIRTGPFGSQLRHAEFISEGVPVLGIDNVVTNRFRWARVRCLPLERYDEFKQFRVLPGDVLITIMGTTGRVCVAPSDLPECMSTKHLCVITFDRSKIDPLYAWASILHDPFVRQQVRTSGHGAIMEGWNMGIVSSLRLRRPPIEQQREFADLVLRLEKQRTHQENVDETLDELFSSLAHRAFSGELTAKWREAHWEQLRAEMAEQAKLLNLSVPEAAKAHG